MNFVKIFWIGISYLVGIWTICVAVPLLSHEGLWYCSVRYDLFTRNVASASAMNHAQFNSETRLMSTSF